MNEMKMMSVRIEAETIAKIDKFCEDHYYWNRNLVIRQILAVVFTKFENKDVYDMVRYCDNYRETVTAKFEIVRCLPKYERD